MVTQRCRARPADTQKEGAVGAIRQPIELHAVMLDGWICHRANTEQHTPYAHSAIDLDTFYGGTMESIESNPLDFMCADKYD